MNPQYVIVKADVTDDAEDQLRTGFAVMTLEAWEEFQEQLQDFFRDKESLTFEDPEESAFQVTFDFVEDYIAITDVSEISLSTATELNRVFNAGTLDDNGNIIFGYGQLGPMLTTINSLTAADAEDAIDENDDDLDDED